MKWSDYIKLGDPAPPSDIVVIGKIADYLLGTNKGPVEVNKLTEALKDDVNAEGADGKKSEADLPEKIKAERDKLVSDFKAMHGEVKQSTTKQRLYVA